MAFPGTVYFNPQINRGGDERGNHTPAREGWYKISIFGLKTVKIYLSFWFFYFILDSERGEDSIRFIMSIFFSVCGKLLPDVLLQFSSIAPFLKAFWIDFRSSFLNNR